LWLAESLYVRRDPTADQALLALVGEAVDPEVVSRSYCSLGQHALESNDLVAAKTYFGRAYDILPESATTGWRLGALIRSEDPRKAAALLATALARARRERSEIRFQIAADLCGVLLGLEDVEQCRQILGGFRAEGDFPPNLQEVWDSLPEKTS
jgi:hypothetical protein